MSKLLNTKQAAKIKDVSVRRIQALITKGQLKAEKVGRDYLIRESALNNIEQRAVGRPKGSVKKKDDTQNNG